MMTASDWSGVASTYLDYLKSDDDRLRRELLDPLILSLLDPPGKTILDLGCGEGYFARVVKLAGAKRVIGVDISPGLIEDAHKQDAAVEYEVYDIVADQLLYPNTLDAVVAHMVMMDVSEIETAYEKISASLAPSGRLVVSIVNPYYGFPAGRWRKPDAPRRRLPFLKKPASENKYEHELFITEYFGARMVQKSLGQSAPVPHFHRSVSDYINLAAKHGLVLRKYLEPGLSADLKQRYPGLLLAKALDRVPLFLVLQFDKSA